MTNKFIRICTLFGLTTLMVACESNKKSTVTESGAEVVKIRTPTVDTINKDEAPPLETKTVAGKVLEINSGKDGYTAKLQTLDNEIYFVTISHSNLKDHSEYKSVKVGDALIVTGDFWKLENDKQITVRKIN